MTKFTYVKFQKCLTEATSAPRANSLDPDEAAHYEPPHLELSCL